MIIKAHPTTVLCLAWSPDGTRIVAGGGAPTIFDRQMPILIWDASDRCPLFHAKGRTLLTYHGHGEYWVNAVAWSPDGKYIASGSENLTTSQAETLQIWEAVTGQKLMVCREHSEKDVRALAWSPDGKHLAEGSDGKVQIWELATGRIAATYTGHASPQHVCHVDSVAWSPNGRYISSASPCEHSVAVWDATTGELILNHSHDLARGSVCAVAWAPDGRSIASGSDTGRVEVWNATTGEARLVYGRDHSHGEKLALAWSPDSTRIALSLHNLVEVWDAATGKLLSTYRGHTLFCRIDALAWSPDGKRIASGGTDCQVHVWKP